MDRPLSRRFDPIDHRFMRVRGRLSPGERLFAMLAAREWVVGAFRNRLRRRYPNLSPEELNLKVLEEIDRTERTQIRSDSDAPAAALGPDVMEIWKSIKEAARQEASRDEAPD